MTPFQSQQILSQQVSMYSGQKEGRAKRIAVAAVGENTLSVARRLSRSLNRTGLSCVLFFLLLWKNNYLLPLLLSLWLAS